MTGKLSYKMYVWDNVLADHTPGMVCVLAVSRRQALSLLKKANESAWKECSKLEPYVYNKPGAVYCYGGG